MIEVAIPGDGRLRLSFLVLDYNGTLACNGVLLDGVAERLIALSKNLSIHVVTADTFGTVEATLKNLPLHRPSSAADGPESRQDGLRVPIGAQRDGLHRQRAQRPPDVAGGCARHHRGRPEGAAVDALQASDVVTTSIQSALDLLLNPLRLVATLRS